MNSGTKVISLLLLVFCVAIIFSVGVPYGPEALLILLFVGIPLYLLHRLVTWAFGKVR